MNRIEYLCVKCNKISLESLRPCVHCGHIGELIILTDYSEVTFGELVHWMNKAPMPWPLSKVFIPKPCDGLSLSELRTLHELRRRYNVP